MVSCFVDTIDLRSTFEYWKLIIHWSHLLRCFFFFSPCALEIGARVLLVWCQTFVTLSNDVKLLFLIFVDIEEPVLWLGLKL